MAGPIRKILAVAALAPVALLAACGGSSTPSSSSAKMVGSGLPSAPSTKSESITETGSTLLFPLFGTWSTAYQKLWDPKTDPSRVTITTGGTGSGTGITDAAANVVNIGASDAYLSTLDAAKYPGLMNIALAISAQEISYNLPGIKDLKLNGTLLAQIYTGKITMWNAPQIKAVNPGVPLPALKIITLHRGDSSGDTFLFTSYLNAQDPSAWGQANVGTTVSWPTVPGALAEQGNSGMVAGCAADKGCIAYVGISYLAKTQAAALGTASLANKAGTYEQPTTATISAEADAVTASTPASESLSMINDSASTGYPIANYEYAIVSKTQSNGDQAEDIRAFLNWCVHTGQSGATYLDAVNFQPLPASVVTLSDNQIAKIGS